MVSASGSLGASGHWSQVSGLNACFARAVRRVLLCYRPSSQVVVAGFDALLVCPFAGAARQSTDRRTAA